MRKGSKMSLESRKKIKEARARQVITEESNLKRSLAMRGKRKPKEFGEKIRQARIRRKERLGYINSPETKIKIGLAGKGRKATEETRKRQSEAMRGKRSPYWEGGITPLNLAIRRTYKYRLWRSDVFTRDEFTCQKCFKKGGVLNVHHLKSFCIILKENNIKLVEEALCCEELWDINNGKTLCEECHKETDNYKRKAIKLKKNI